MTERLVTLGEVMLRLSPPRFQRLRSARSLDIHVAGAQLNVAADFARLGGEAAFVSKLPATELGWLAHDTCRSYGVDMRHVQMLPDVRMGINYLEFTVSPRAPVAIFDRKGSAASTMTPDDFDWAAILDGATIAHTDGIVPGLGDSVRETATAFLQTARAMGVKTSFDVNYREHLWTESAARACWEQLLPLVDVIVTNRGVSEAVFDFHGSDEDIMRAYHDAFGCEWVCLTQRELFGLERGAWSSKLLAGGQVFAGRRYEFESLDRYGTGDAYFAGVLYGYARSDAQYAVDFGDAACALAHTTEGDVIPFAAHDVERLLGETIDLRVKR
ncbi:MAG: sugar kinase [Anaerolineae bacterium]|nr:sugar kinase [Anaerolineae bacterium]